MKLIYTTATILTLLLTTFLVSAQGGKAVRPIPPELLAKNKKAGEARDRGKALMAKREYEQAIVAFRLSIAIEGDMNRMFGETSSSGNYELAKALTAAGRKEEALAAYKNAFWWSERRQDLAINGPPVSSLASDYAVLLAQCGKEDEAKMIYYFALRSFNPSSNKGVEPVPFVVLFDPDPEMIVWDYSADRLVAAAMMIRLVQRGWAEREAMKEVLRLEPSWSFPTLFLATFGPAREKPVRLKQVESHASTERERQWIRDYAAGMNLAEVGLRMRKNSVVLIQAKKDIAKNYRRVARDYVEK